MSQIALVYVPFGAPEQAEEAARMAVSQRLAACANILGAGQSIYEWEGQMEAASETIVLFKTAEDRRAALMSALESFHDYDLPAILTWPAHTTAAYAAWVWQETRPKE